VKPPSLFFLFTLSLFSLNSCSDDLNIISGSESVPVVYCIMDPLDTVYRVLLTRTFAGNRSASDLAQDPDLISFRKANVSLEAWSQGYTVWKTTFVPVLNERDSGLFSSKPGCGFESRDVMLDFFGTRLLGSIDSLFDYLRLVVYYEDNEEPAYSRIPSTNGKPRITSPLHFAKTFNLCDTIPYHIDFYASEQYYYDLRCKVYYYELTDERVEKSYEFSYLNNIPTQNGIHSQAILPNQFFQRFAERFPKSQEVLQREYISCDFIVNKGSKSLKTFMNTYNSDNDHGYELWNCFHNGIGLFALKSYTALTGMKMDQRTLDSLAIGRYSKDLKFKRLW
jgi:hypothetical protein